MLDREKKSEISVSTIIRMYSRLKSADSGSRVGVFAVALGGERPNATRDAIGCILEAFA